MGNVRRNWKRDSNLKDGRVTETVHIDITKTDALSPRVLAHDQGATISIFDITTWGSLCLNRDQAEGLLIELLTALNVRCRETASNQPYLVVIGKNGAGK